MLFNQLLGDILGTQLGILLIGFGRTSTLVGITCYGKDGVVAGLHQFGHLFDGFVNASSFVGITLGNLEEDGLVHILLLIHLLRTLHNLLGNVGLINLDGVYDFNHLGDELMNSIKWWLRNVANLVAARYVVVDAVNQAKVLDFYARNQFWTVFKTEEDERIANELEEGKPLLTRFMISDLKL